MIVPVYWFLRKFSPARHDARAPSALPHEPIRTKPFGAPPNTKQARGVVLRGPGGAVSAGAYLMTVTLSVVVKVSGP